MGRPVKIDDTVLQKLEVAFCHGMTDHEACLFAGISPQTLYNYQKKHSDFIDRKETLKKAVTMRARLNISDAISDGDVDVSKWYLERKCRDEFGKDPSVVVNADSIGVSTVADDIKDYLKTMLS